jgi:hypothetical protein
MPRLAELQLVGPISLLLVLVGADGVGLALGYMPASQALWYAHLYVFWPVSQSQNILGAYIDIEHNQLYLVGLPIFVIGCAGFYFKRLLALAIASNLSLIYSSFLICAPYARTGRFGSIAEIAETAATALCMSSLLGCTLLSFAASHIIYIRAIRQERVTSVQAKVAAGAQLQAGLGRPDRRPTASSLRRARAVGPQSPWLEICPR